MSIEGRKWKQNKIIDSGTFGAGREDGMRLLLDFNVPTFVVGLVYFSSIHVVSCFFEEAVSETFNVFISLYFLTANILSLVITTTLISQYSYTSLLPCFSFFIFFILFTYHPVN